VNRIRVLLAEDHETVRQGLRLLIDQQRDMTVVDEVANGRLAVERARTGDPDVVVMDISMPEMNGLLATRELRRGCPALGIVALTRHDDEAYVQQLLAAGASGYVLKRSPSSELLAAIRAVANGRQYLDTTLGARLVGVLRGASAVRGGPSTRPSDRENEVLRLVAVGYSNMDIGSQLNISVKTVEVHKARAMKKLGLRGRIDVVRYAVLQGWLRDE
jgi:two-component system, NarL family, response regulator NreC